MMPVLGQIGLCLRADGTWRNRWTEDDIAWFVGEKYLDRDAPADRVWLALSAGDSSEARLALARYRTKRDDAADRRDVASPDQIRELLNFPGQVLKVQLRASEVLVARLG